MTTSTLHRRAAAPGLEQLVDAIRAALVDPGDWAAAATSVGDAVRAQLPDASILDAAARAGAPERHAGHRLHVEPDGSFSVLALVWRQHQWTAVHDHVTWCVFATVHGEPVEDLFALSETEDALIPAGRQACPVGTVSGGAPPGDIHRLGNPHAETAITLHVYGTDVSRIGTSLRRTYDLPVTR
jgi:predicted metal-dependent enzyme (double-stranded beta helix superfamily)